MKKAFLISLLMVLCPLSGCTDVDTEVTRDCPQEVLLESVEDITSFEVCKIEIDKMWAIDGMRFVFADGSYIDTGRVGGGGEEFIVPENHVITRIEYAIHNRSKHPGGLYNEEVEGIVSMISFCIDDVTDVSDPPRFDDCTDFSTPTYSRW